jgi:hypothetical protein
MQDRHGGIGNGLAIGTHHPASDDRCRVLGYRGRDHSGNRHADRSTGKNIPEGLIHSNRLSVRDFLQL